MKKATSIKVILAALIGAAILTGCANNASSNPVPSTTGEIGATASGSENADSDPAATAGATTGEILDTVLKVSEIPSVVIKDKSELADYYDFPEKDIVNASFAICGSGAYPDEAAIFEVVTDKKTGKPTADVLNAVTQSVLRRIEKRSEEFSTYTPDEMYKLDESNLGVLGDKYVVYTALADNDGAYAAAKALLDSSSTETDTTSATSATSATSTAASE